MPEIPVDVVQVELIKAIAYMEERLPPGFKVKDMGVVELKALRDEIEAAIRDELEKDEAHDKSRVHRNNRINAFAAFRVDCRRAVSLEFNDDSPEYVSIPWSDPHAAKSK